MFDVNNLPIILSLEDGKVWASWPDDRPRVALGEQAVVVEAMSDFLAQTAVAKRLMREALTEKGRLANPPAVRSR